MGTIKEYQTQSRKMIRLTPRVRGILFALMGMATIIIWIIMGVLLFLTSPARSQESPNIPVHTHPDEGDPLNPEVTQETINATVCVAGWSASVRPAYKTSHNIKKMLMDDAHIPHNKIHMYQLDHVIPICLGGNPSSLSNLALQPKIEAYAKDKVEVFLCCMVCNGEMTLSHAQLEIRDWQNVFSRHENVSCVRKYAPME